MAMYEYWHKQHGKPLYPNLFWSRPEQQQLAGSLLIVGGSVHSIAAPHEAFEVAVQAGAGTTRVMLPDATRKLFGRSAGTEVLFAPSTSTGSFAAQALDSLQQAIFDVDATVLAGDFSRNSESGIMLEACSKLAGRQTYTKDALDYFAHLPRQLLDREQTLLVPSFAQLQHFVSRLPQRRAMTFAMGLVPFVELLHRLTSEYACSIAISYHDTLCISNKGQVITTPFTKERATWRINMAVRGSLWTVQQPHDTLGALASAGFEVADPDNALLL